MALSLCLKPKAEDPERSEGSRNINLFVIPRHYIPRDCFKPLLKAKAEDPESQRGAEVIYFLLLL